MSRTCRIFEVSERLQERDLIKMSDHDRTDNMDLPEVTQEDRTCMISAGAWFRAKDRAFTPGDPVSDWLQTEAEIDANVRTVSAQRRWAEYETDRHLRWSVADRFPGDTPADTDAVMSAIDAVASQMTEAEGYDPAVVSRVADTFRKDIANWTHAHHEHPEEQRLVLGKWQERGQVLLHTARASADDVRKWFSDKVDHYRTYYAGEVVPPGGYLCVNCQTCQEIANTAHLRPCGNCYQTHFRRL